MTDMKLWLRYVVWTLEVAAVLAVAYFEPTYGVRGVLRGDAFYEGKSATYWQQRIDRWMAQFGSDEDAGAAVVWYDSDQQVALSGTAIWMSVDNNPPTVMERVRTFFRWDKNADVGFAPPAVLTGGPAAEPVLRQLGRDSAYEAVIASARKQAGGPRSVQLRTKQGVVINIRVAR